MIAIIDYDVGNLGAVANMLRRIGVPCVITDDADIIASANGVVLPGNGSFDACMKGFRATGLIPVVEQRVLSDGVPLLGICVGAQMLGLGSDEGVEPGLGWMDMWIKRFPKIEGLRVPHMGWNDVRIAHRDNAVVNALDPEPRFYFVHSYYMEPASREEVLLETRYGIDFAAAVSRRNILGVQFHPEKSHRFGKQFLGAFAEQC